MSKPSNSSEHQLAEAKIRAGVADHLGTELQAAILELGDGAQVQVDGVAADHSAFVEVQAHQGPLKGGQKHKVAKDALKLITIRQSRPDARLVIAFADAQAASYATTGTWMAEALKVWDVEVVVVELDYETRAGISAAQVRQRMVNPAGPPPDDAELD